MTVEKKVVGVLKTQDFYQVYRSTSFDGIESDRFVMAQLPLSSGDESVENYARGLCDGNNCEYVGLYTTEAH